MTALQELIMNAYRNDQMGEIEAMMRKRIQESEAADYTGMNAANMYGRGSLESMIAQATNQQAPRKGIMDLISDEQSVGGPVINPFGIFGY